MIGSFGIAGQLCVCDDDSLFGRQRQAVISPLHIRMPSHCQYGWPARPASAN
jgi:hypothetical protein